MSSTFEVSVISLQTAVERREKIAAQFAGFPSDWSFFDAHTSLANPKLSYDEEKIVRRFGRPLSRPELACWSSHYTAIQRFLEESPNDYLLVFEDDVLFDTAFPIHKIVDFCSEKGINYIRLYGMYDAEAVNMGFFFDRSIIRYKSSPAGTQAYIMSKEGARKFTESSRRVESTIDLAIDSFWRTGLPIYSVFPFPAIERFSPSSIPMNARGVLSAGVWSAWAANRALNKLRKYRENSRLARMDAKFRKMAMRFQQIQPQDLSPA